MIVEHNEMKRIVRCTSCSQGRLGLTNLVDGPPCQQCEACGGKLLALTAYLTWVNGREAWPEVTKPRLGAFEPEPGRNDTKRAMCCPQCAGLMLRFHVLPDRQHGLDFCFHCEVVWLDRGEWAYLKVHGLHTQIRRIATDAYQRQLRAQAMSDAQRERYQSMWGDDVFAQIEDFRSWLAQQPGREKILRYLTTKP